MNSKKTFFFNNEDVTKENLLMQQLLSEIALDFIKKDDFSCQITDALKLIGNSLNVSRIYVFEDSEDGRKTSNTYEWCNENIKSWKDKLQEISYESFPSWKPLLIQNNIICCENIEELPADIYKVLKRQEILSILVYPIYINKEIRGFIGFEENREYRKWTELEIEFLRTISWIISNVYDKRNNEKLLIESKERIDNIINAASVGTWEWNIQTEEIIINERYANILGYNLDELVPIDVEKWVGYMHEEDLENSDKIIKDHFEGKTEFYDCELRMKHKNGSWIWCHDRGKVRKLDKDGKPLIMFGLIFDVTERKKSEEEILKLTTAIEQASVSIVMTDEDGNIQYGNPAFEKATGYSLEEALGKNPRILKSGLTPDEVFEDMWKTITEGKSWEGDLINKRKDGSIYFEEARITPIVNKQGKIVNYLGIKQDISQRKYLEERLKQTSIRDSLTNIYNRRYVFERLYQILELYRREGNIFSIAIIDMDFFKKINDTYGHQAGDLVLKEFSEILTLSTRAYDILGRYGGEEFIIVFQGSSKQASKAIVERILEKIREFNFRYKDKEIKITFSCGICEVTEVHKDSLTVENIVNVADKRLYKAKNSGRNQIVID